MLGLLSRYRPRGGTTHFCVSSSRSKGYSPTRPSARLATMPTQWDGVDIAMPRVLSMVCKQSSDGVEGLTSWGISRALTQTTAWAQPIGSLRRYRSALSVSKSRLLTQGTLRTSSQSLRAPLNTTRWQRNGKQSTDFHLPRGASLWDPAGSLSCYTQLRLRVVLPTRRVQLQPIRRRLGHDCG